jgi:hypothetical protein
MFEMAAPVQSPAKCKVHSVIRFLNAKDKRPAEIHKQIVAIYGDVMNQQTVKNGAMNSPNGKIMSMTNKGAVGHL